MCKPSLLPVPGGPPTTFAILASSPYNAIISWTPPTVPNGIITHYTIYIDFGNGSTVTVYPQSADRQFNLTYLSPFQNVTARVTAFTMIGEGPPTVFRQTVTFEIREFFPPDSSLYTMM